MVVFAPWKGPPDEGAQMPMYDNISSTFANQAVTVKHTKANAVYTLGTDEKGSMEYT